VREAVVMIETWILWSWLCTGPGAAGERRPLPDPTLESRAACLQALRAAQQAEARIVAHCQEVKRVDEARPDDGAAAGDRQGEAR